MAVNSFHKALHRGCLKGFSVSLGLGICMMPGFWIYILLWIYQGPNYAKICRVSKYTRVLNMPGVPHGDTPWLHRVRHMPEYSFINPKCAWICLNMLEWFCFAFPCSNFLSIWTHGYLFQIWMKLDDIVWRNMRLFFWRDNVWFFYRTWKYLLFFLL